MTDTPKKSKKEPEAQTAEDKLEEANKRIIQLEEIIKKQGATIFNQNNVIAAYRTTTADLAAAISAQ